MQFGCQQTLLHPEKGTQSILEYLCSESNKVYNCSLYYGRQATMENEHSSISNGWGYRLVYTICVTLGQAVLPVRDCRIMLQQK